VSFAGLIAGKPAPTGFANNLNPCGSGLARDGAFRLTDDFKESTMLQLILGGARSGKSRLAEKLACDSALAVTYIATSQPLDGEMNERVAHHRARRPVEWALIEEPIELARVLRDSARVDRCLLVDCLTLWMTNLLMLEDDQRLIAERDALLDCLASLPGEIIFVSNETGMGVVPLGELTRRYVDEAGWLHQALAERCQRVVLTVAGLPLTLKGTAL
jgi:adenosylcobinamide kinase/adenosylcobinamide-phosphate guanylyltransferase